MKYRPEIDGLRAIAVIPVILFHAGFQSFSGGFVGVDVFFVISGYLITTILLSEMEQDKFSLITFYERRARRILPALFLVMLVSLPFAWLWLRPPDMKDFSQSLIAVSYFSSNFLFWLQTGYWGTANELKPLLHTWSLAVEEQYYVIFPLCLMLIWRLDRRWILSFFMVIAGISFAVAQWGAYNIPSATFFLLPTRIWELALGASLAFFSIYRKQTLQTLLSHKTVNEAMGLVGLTLISYAVFMFNETVPFPGFLALFPTLGTALIILFASPQTVVGRFLGTRILVAIGLLSYSAYLWHQPLFAFARHRSLTEPDALFLASLIVPVFLLAYLSWKYVEQPFRSRQQVSKKAIFLFWLISTVIFVEIGVAGQLTNGFDGRLARRYPPPIAQTLTPDFIDRFKLSSIEQALTVKSIDQIKVDAMEKQWQSHRQQTVDDGFGLSRDCDGAFTAPACRTSDAPEIMVWGDSFAMHLVPGILASNPEAKIIQITKSVCGPFFDVAPIAEPDYPVRWSKSCLEFTATVRRWIQTNPTVNYAVISSPFSHYLLEDEKLLIRSGEHIKGNFDFAVQEFERTLTELESVGIKPVIFSPPPANDLNLGRCLARAEWMGLNLDKCNFQADEMSQKRLVVYDFLETIQKKYRVICFDKLLCDSSLCKTHLGPTWLYRDARHFTDEGSAALGKQYNFYHLITED